MAAASGPDVVDVVGIGFGPSNLGLAIALEEFNRRPGPSVVTSTFVEAAEAFAWHPDMLLPESTMQISFLKDLVTLRDVRSEYSFLNYLAESGRLVHFINHQTFFPSRREFHDYLCWAAAKVCADVRYGARAQEVVWRGDRFVVTCADGTEVAGRNLVVAPGLRERLPDGVVPTARVFHNHRLLRHLDRLPGPDPVRFAVVGAGQSAAEVAAYLHDRYPEAAVHAVFGKYGYSPSDDSPYANRVFDPDAVDDFYAAPPEVRGKLLDYHHATNYSAVDLELIEELYRREYAERVVGRRRLFVEGASSCTIVDQSAERVRVRVRRATTAAERELDCDAVVYATGFTPHDLGSVLGSAAAAVRYDATGPIVARDYRVATDGTVGGGIYLQGGTEHTHGLTSSLLSNVAVRCGEIVEAIAADLAAGRAVAGLDPVTARSAV